MAVAVAVEGTFHYLVSAELDMRIVPGMRILVPFGRRRVTGYVLDRVHLHETPADIPDLKAVIEPLDDGPLFGPSMVPFFRFVADYYHYPLGLVIAEALPAGLKVMSQRTVKLTPEGREALCSGAASAAEAALMNRLDRREGVSLSGLMREKGDCVKLLRRLSGRGWAAAETRLRPDRIRAKTQKWLLPLDGLGEAELKLGARERELLTLLAQLGPTPVDEIRKEVPGWSAVANRLQMKHRIRIEERAVYRDSLGRALYFNGHIPKPTPEQDVALNRLSAALESGQFAPFLLHGVTGSGKTEVYLASAARAMALGRTVLFLVPEIALTPSLEGLCRARFGEDVAVLHSGLSDGERYDQWLKIRRREVRLVVGARSAIFAPLEDLGLVVVDEEHDGAYKQEDKLRYQARDLALLRGQQSGAVVVLGSATPSLESYNAVRSGRFQLLTLDHRVGQGRLPEVAVVDLRLDSGRRRGAISPFLKKALAETLERGEQALLFINRRGLAGLPICLACGEVVKCLNCSVTLTLHQPSAGATGQNRLVCHYCGFDTLPPTRCPSCQSALFRYLGIGTERLEEEVRNTFPGVRVGRLDSDTARPKGELTRILEDLRDRKLDVLVGTQMITKGHDFPNITLVGVIDADLGLHLPDFRAGERVFQLLSQVGGRAGRGENPGRVIIQTVSPDHYSLLRAQHHDYHGFAEIEMAQRRDLGYPPFSRLVMVRLMGNSDERTRHAAEDAAAVGREILTETPADVEILGPAPAPLAKVKGKHRQQILIRGSLVRPLHGFLVRWLDRVRPGLRGQGVSLTVDVDPYQMM